jgi:arylsulfatase
MLHKLQRLWLIEATKYNAIPLDDRQAERILPELAGRPTLIHGNTQLLFPGMGRLSELSVLNLKNKSFSATAEIEVGKKPANGVVVAQGGRFGGWTVFFDQGCVSFDYNVLGIRHFPVEATTPITPGQHQVRMEFAYDGGGLGKGGNVTLYYDGKPVGSGRIERTQPLGFSSEETTDVGCETGSRVTDDYPARNGHFNGKIHWVQFDVGKDNFSHLIKPEDRLRVVMTRQ